MAMNNFNPLVGQPVRSVQTYLRKIAYNYKGVPQVIPDGKFGEQTKDSVLGFQRTFNLEVTGEVNKDTWDKILLVYTDILEYEGEPLPANLYPSGKYVILPKEENENLYVIQSMMLVLSTYYINIGTVQINGINDENNVKVVEQFQKIFGIAESGVIDKQFWNKLSGLYEVKVSKNRF